MYQYPNGDILIGFWWRIVQNTTANLGNLYKLSSNLDSLWRKPLPRPNYYTNERTSVYEFLPMANGDIVVGGGYINGPLPSDAIFLCRLDSTGEIPVVATENVVIQKEKIKIFPNPTNDFVTFTNLSSKIESKGFLQIYDEQGKQVYSNSLIDFTSFTVNTSEWASGLYLYRYIVENVPSQEGKINIIK